MSSASSSYQIFVKTLTGKAFVLAVCSQDTVGDLKQKILDKHGVPVDSQRLLFAGKQLLDESMTLERANIGKESCIHLITRLVQVNETANSKEKEEEQQQKEKEEEDEESPFPFASTSAVSGSASSSLRKRNFNKNTKKNNNQRREDPQPPQVYQVAREHERGVLLELCFQLLHLFLRFQKTLLKSTSVQLFLRFCCWIANLWIVITSLNFLSTLCQWLLDLLQRSWNTVFAPLLRMMHRLVVVELNQRLLFPLLRALWRFTTASWDLSLDWITVVWTSTIHSLQWMNDAILQRLLRPLRQACNILSSVFRVCWSPLSSFLSSFLSNFVKVAGRCLTTTERMLWRCLHAVTSFLFIRLLRPLLRGFRCIVLALNKRLLFPLLSALNNLRFRLSQACRPVFASLFSKLNGLASRCLTKSGRMLWRCLRAISFYLLEPLLRGVSATWKTCFIPLLSWTSSLLQWASRHVLQPMWNLLFVRPLLFLWHHRWTRKLVAIVFYLYNDVLLWQRRHGVRNGNYLMDIRPALRMIPPSPASPSSHFHVLEDGQTYGVYLRNDSLWPCLCLLSIDGEDMGTFRLEGKTACTIRRPVHSQRCFTFAVDSNALAFLLDDDAGASVSASSSKANGGWLDSLSGVVEVKFVPRAAGRANRRQKRGGRSGGNAGSVMQVATATNDLQEEARSDDKEEEEETKERLYAVGKTELKGTSDQVVSSVAGFNGVTMDRAVVTTTQLIGRASSKPASPTAGNHSHRV